MSTLLLYPRLAESDTVRVWIGVTEVTSAPSVTWYVDGQPASPTILRPLSSARSGALLKGNPTRAFTGVVQFSGLSPDTRYRVYARATMPDGSIRKRVLDVYTLPRQIPKASDGWFNVLLASCFHFEEEARGHIGRTVADIANRGRIHLSVLMGDQVYLDLPTLKNFKDNTRWLAKKFEDDYLRNWDGADVERGLPHVLAAAPSVHLPDDHEYWNNAPHWATVIGNSHSADGRARWKRAAQALWDAFQQPVPAGFADAVTLDVPPVSLFFADSRSDRQHNRSRALSDVAYHQLVAWMQHLRAHRYVGVFVTGQSLLQKPQGFKGKTHDYALADYGDYGAIVTQLLSAPRDLFWVTGDVHWGRVSQVTGTGPFQHHYEVISSPMALVTNPGSSLKKAWSWLRRSDEPFARHNDAAKVPNRLAGHVIKSRHYCRRLHPQRGDQLCVLSFRQMAQHVETRVSFWPIHKAQRGPVDVGLPQSR